MEKSKLVSIIVPIYNCEKYLSKTLDSIINQTYRNIEIILVNDGSSDDSEKICEKYIQKDDRIKYFYQENFGVSSARNKGLFYSNGEYISFIDSDDWIELDMIQSLVNVLEEYNLDVVNCGVEIVDKDGSVRQIFDDGKVNFYPKDDLLKLFLLGKLSHGCWDKLYTRRSIENLDFPLGTTGEDRYFCWQLYKKINKFASLGIVKYHYIRRTENSITSLPISKKNLSRIEEALAVKNDIILHFPNLEREWEFYYILGLENLLKKYCNNHEIQLDKNFDIYVDFMIKEAYAIITKNENDYISNEIKNKLFSYINLLKKKIS